MSKPYITTSYYLEKSKPTFLYQNNYHQYNIDYLSKILKPFIGVITNIGNSHLEQLKNMEGVLNVKSELINNIKRGGNLIVPSENIKHLSFWKQIMSWSIDGYYLSQ